MSETKSFRASISKMLKMKWENQERTYEELKHLSVEKRISEFHKRTLNTMKKYRTLKSNEETEDKGLSTESGLDVEG